MTEPMTRYGRHLWRLLPQHVRTRDAGSDHDLLALLDAIGGELDRLRGTLDQRLAEAAPGAQHPVHRLHPDDVHRQPQPWLLPYMAELLDVRLTAPSADGQRAEIQHAVRWRKGKGTAHIAEAAAELLLGGAEVELIEGRDIVATTPRIDLELLPESSFTTTPRLGDESTWRTQPLAAAAHPGLPTVTPDVRTPGRSVSTDPLHPRARRRSLPGEDDDVVWRHLDTRAAPCFPGSHEDVARRTPDVRRPTHRTGWHHPKTLVALLTPPAGFFAPADERDESPTEVERTADELHVVRDVSVGTGGVTVSGGQLLLGPAEVDGPIVVTAPGTHHLVDVVQTGDARVVAGAGVTIEAHRCALGSLELSPGAADGGRGRLPDWPVRPEPVDATDALVAVDCLLGVVEAAGRVTLDRCTVLDRVTCDVLRAADTILPDDVTVGGSPGDSCLRFSRLPDGLPPEVRRHRSTVRPPLFSPAVDCEAWGSTTAAGWGEPGCGVLHPDCPTAITTGAEDGGEMGAHHHLHHVQARMALVTKLTDLVTVGITPVVAPDIRLSRRPPQEPTP